MSRCPRDVPPHLSAQSHGGSRRRLTLEGAVCPDVVQEESGREDQEDEQQPRPGESPALHLAQQLLGRREDEAPSPRGRGTPPRSRLLSPPTPGFPVGTSVICRAAGRMEQGQHHLSPACPADAPLQGPPAWHVPAAGEADRDRSTEPKSGCRLRAGTTRPMASRPVPGLTLQAASQAATSSSLLGPLAASSSFVTLNERTVSCSD